MANQSVSNLRILCLHGYRQSEKTFRQKTGSLRKILKNKAELVYMTAPNRVLEQEKVEGEPEDQYGWWFSTESDAYNAREYTDCCKGYQKSVEGVAEFMVTNGPFDGVLAFSQGAAFLTLICALGEKGDERFKFKFAIFVAGFKSRQSHHRHLYDTVVTIPTLHVIGDTDRVIPRDMSDELLNSYQDPVVLRHAGGHFVPTSGPQKSEYAKFLKQFLDLR